MHFLRYSGDVVENHHLDSIYFDPNSQQHQKTHSRKTNGWTPKTPLMVKVGNSSSRFHHFHLFRAVSFRDFNTFFTILERDFVPVVPHKAVAEVSRIGDV